MCSSNGAAAFGGLAGSELYGVLLGLSARLVALQELVGQVVQELELLRRVAARSVDVGRLKSFPRCVPFDVVASGVGPRRNGRSKVRPRVRDRV
jgi:hypothetical protein